MITDEKTHDIATKILQCMENGISVGQFLDALTWSQSVILSQTTYKGIREIASEIRDKIIANATFIKESNDERGSDR